MTIQAQSADGVIHEFPDGTNPAVIDGAMKAYAQKGAPKKAGGFVAGAKDFAKNVVGGLADDAAQFGDTLLDASPLGIIHKAANVGNMFKGALVQPAAPIASTVQRDGPQPQGVAGSFGRTVGQMAPAAVLPGSVGARIANVFAPAVASEGAGQAAKAMGAGPTGQTVARAVGGLAGGASASMRLNPSSVAKRANVTLDDLQSAKNAAYDAVDNAGVQYKPEAVQSLASSIKTDLAGARFDPDFHPTVAKVLQKIDGKVNEGWSPSLSELDDLRKFVRENAVDGASNTEARLGKKVMSNIDSFIQQATPDQVIGGESGDAAKLLATARDLHTRTVKVQAVNDALDAAGMNAGKAGSGGNIDNATRQALDRVRKSIPNLSDEEDAALRGIILGGKGQNLLRQVGKLSPQGNGLMAAGNLAAAGMGGPLATIPGFAGLVSKIAADGMTKAKVQNLVQLMANGGTKAAPKAAGVIATKPKPLLTPPNPFSDAAVAGGLLSASPALSETQR